ncbi:hypothetical protein ANO14919_091980 [Xylariales sp. No.14919]|nr:hypothetical protein ANO14919_091980 [Xylariales sp. No.14919]
MIGANQIFAKMIYKFDWKLINTDLDWLGESPTYIMWRKPDPYIEFKGRGNKWFYKPTDVSHFSTRFRLVK